MTLISNLKAWKDKNKRTYLQFKADKSAKDLKKQQAEKKTIKPKNDELHTEIETLRSAACNKESCGKRYPDPD